MHKTAWVGSHLADDIKHLVLLATESMLIGQICKIYYWSDKDPLHLIANHHVTWLLLVSSAFIAKIALSLSSVILAAQAKEPRSATGSGKKGDFPDPGGHRWLPSSRFPVVIWINDLYRNRLLVCVNLTFWIQGTVATGIVQKIPQVKSKAWTSITSIGWLRYEWSGSILVICTLKPSLFMLLETVLTTPVFIICT